MLKACRHAHFVFFNFFVGFEARAANPRRRVEPSEDQRICGFIKETFEEEISTRKQDVKRLESALLKLTKLG